MGLLVQGQVSMENFTTKPITLLISGLTSINYVVAYSVTLFTEHDSV
jgi:hypothetical protein